MTNKNGSISLDKLDGMLDIIIAEYNDIQQHGMLNPMNNRDYAQVAINVIKEEAGKCGLKLHLQEKAIFARRRDARDATKN